jgi:large subunit ribosomal protein L25
MITLQAQKREGNRKALKAADLIPAVYYGGKNEAVSIAVSSKEFAKVFKEAGETTAVTLTVDGKKVSTMIHDLQRDPITHEPTHIDFLVIDMNKEIEVPVPIEFTGLAEAEKGGLGTLVKVLHEITVRALPANLPHGFEVDVTSLATLDDQIHVKDIKLPKDVTLVTDGEEVVALVAAFKEEVEEETPVDLSSIEVEKKGKKEDEEVAE